MFALRLRQLVAPEQLTCSDFDENTSLHLFKLFILGRVGYKSRSIVHSSLIHSSLPSF